MEFSCHFEYGSFIQQIHHHSDVVLNNIDSSGIKLINVRRAVWTMLGYWARLMGDICLRCGISEAPRADNAFVIVMLFWVFRAIDCCLSRVDCLWPYPSLTYDCGRVRVSHVSHVIQTIHL